MIDQEPKRRLVSRVPLMLYFTDVISRIASSFSAASIHAYHLLSSQRILPPQPHPPASASWRISGVSKDRRRRRGELVHQEASRHLHLDQPVLALLSAGRCRLRAGGLLLSPDPPPLLRAHRWPCLGPWLHWLPCLRARWRRGRRALSPRLPTRALRRLRTCQLFLWLLVLLSMRMCQIIGRMMFDLAHSINIVLPFFLLLPVDDV